MATKPTKRESIALNALTLEDIDTLMELVKKNGVEELEIEGKEARIRIRGATRREETLVAAQPIALPPAPATAIVPGQAPSGDALAATASSPEAGEAEPDESDLIEVKSPMVGTFYRAPAPDAASYVEVGDRITEDTVLCIIEAMKLMNEIKAEVSGIVSDILVENGQPVEFGQTIFKIEPSE